MNNWWKRGPVRPGHLVVLAITWAAIACEPAIEEERDLRSPSAKPITRIDVPEPQAPTPRKSMKPKQPGYRQDYVFSEDWFTHNIPSWKVHFAHYRGQPGLSYLEIGVFEGRSLFWIIDHVLTHPSSRATGIDILIPGNLRSNLELSGAADRVTLIRGFSHVELRKLPLESFDIVYIDGSHHANDVLSDMVLSWELLKPGGHMILDDYAWKRDRNTGVATLPEELLPGIAVDSFTSAYRTYVELVYKDYQVVLRKRAKVCEKGKWFCSTLGAYSYDWNKQILYQGDAEIELTAAELDMVEALIMARRGDGLTLRIPRKLRRSEDLRVLADRLGLPLPRPVDR